MARFPDDMLFYYNTVDGETYYFSVCYNTRENEIRIARIEMDELWYIVKEGNLQLTEIAPLDFPYPLPGSISGNVKAFIL